MEPWSRRFLSCYVERNALLVLLDEAGPQTASARVVLKPNLSAPAQAALLSRFAFTQRARCAAAMCLRPAAEIVRLGSGTPRR